MKESLMKHLLLTLALLAATSPVVAGRPIPVTPDPVRSVKPGCTVSVRCIPTPPVRPLR
jgi:hypothetical protein